MGDRQLNITTFQRSNTGSTRADLPESWPVELPGDGQQPPRRRPARQVHLPLPLARTGQVLDIAGDAAGRLVEGVHLCAPAGSATKATIRRRSTPTRLEVVDRHVSAADDWR